MVVQLTGKIDGKDIIFNRKNGDVWETIIPKNLSGIYVVELTAVDEAGNIGFLAKYIVTIDLSAMRVSLEPYPYRAEVIEDSCHYSNLIGSEYHVELIIEDNCHYSNLIGSEYHAELL